MKSVFCFQILFRFFQILFYCFNLFEELSNYLLCFPCFPHWLWTARDLCTHLQVSNQHQCDRLGTIAHHLTRTSCWTAAQLCILEKVSSFIVFFFCLSCLRLGHPLTFNYLNYLPNYLRTYQCMRLCVHVSTNACTCVSTQLKMYVHTYLPMYPSTHWCIYLPTYLHSYLPTHPSIFSA